jgi:drug/metabolite transporter (DMT)-like permease
LSKKIRAELMLLTTALIWGTAFVAQRSGMDYVGPFTFNGIRFLVGAVVMIPIIIMLDKMNLKNQPKVPMTAEEKKKERKYLWTGGFFCGIALLAGTGLQQMGLVYTSAGKTGFITALYIVIVPIIGIFLGKKVRMLLWVSVALGVVGLYLLSINEGFSINIGDFLVFLCAFGFAAHILVVDHFSPRTDPIRLSAVQFFVCGALSLVIMGFTEDPKLGFIMDAAFPILYTGIMSCCVAYTFQVVAQRNVGPTVASLLLSMESVFAVIFGMLLLSEQLLPKEIVGCIIMFVAIILAQLPGKNERSPL